ncbi:hypothetical protein LCGC14_2329330 [marine sediment metagenome]|uniref:Uncharacterized protein n=1 Tax=marine sediment metagenome TaxID=412755 RepID=A0A0F9CFB6_9ZZZZ
MSRYTKEQCEDVARILAEEKHFQETSGRPEGMIAAGAVINLKHTFADLFAADNPRSPYCGYCGIVRDDRLPCPERGVSGVETRPPHNFLYKGFNREQFLEACGLETETEGTHLPSDILGREH